MTNAAELAATRVREWMHNPVLFVRQCLGATPEAWQADVLMGCARGPRTVVVGSKGCGKTTVEAWLLLWWLATRRQSNIAATSITGDNLRDGLWKEAALWLGRSPILSSAFHWHAERIVSKTHEATWWAAARKWSKTANAQQQSDALAGLHARYTAFFIDEAGSIPRAVVATAEAALASGKECKLVLSGNPTSTDGPLYDAAVTHAGDWHVVHINGDPKSPTRSTRVGLAWAQKQIELYGRENPWVRVNVFGEFPEQSINALLGPEEVRAAMRRELQPSVYEWAQKRIGIDVARFGDDRTVLFPRQGRRAFNPRVERFARGAAVSTDLANIIVAAKTKWGSELEVLDATGGWAAGTRDVLVSSGYSPLEVQFHGKAIDPRYENRRAEMWFAMADWVKKGAQLPPIDELIGELTAPTYTFSRTGKLIIEPKDLVKERIMRSPDLADALALTFGQPEQPRGMQHTMGRAVRAGDDDDDQVPRGYTSELGELRRRDVRAEPFPGYSRAIRAGEDDEED